MSPQHQASAAIPPPAMMLQTLAGFWVAKAVNAAATLGLPDRLKDGPKSPGELARATGSHEPSLRRLLRGLSSAGIVRWQDDGRIATTPLAATLETDAPESLRYFAMLMMGQDHYGAWGNLVHSVKT